MRRRACLCLGIVGVTESLVASAAEVHFRFRLPDGFKALNEVTSPEGVIPEAILEDARSVDAFGVVLIGGDVVATFAAVEQAGVARLPSTLADVRSIIEQTPKLQGTTALSCTNPLIAKTKCSRFELDRNQPGEAWRGLVYVVPGGDRWATLRVTARLEHYEPLARQLDALVSTLAGITPSTRPPPLPDERDEFPKLLAYIGAGAFAGIALRSLLVRKRKPAGTPVV
jgi:hypothetical protein